MKKTKRILLSLLLVIVFAVLSATPSLAADTQLALSKISDDLLAAFDESTKGESLNVIVWLDDNTTEKYQAQVEKLPLPESVAMRDMNPSLYSLQTAKTSLQTATEAEKLAQIEEIQNYIMEKRNIAQAMYLADNSVVASKLASSLSEGEIVYISKYSPLIVCKVSRYEAISVAKNNNVLKITNGETKFEPVISVSREVVSADQVQDDYGITGQGIKIGMVEQGCPDTTHDCFDGIENKIITKPSSLISSVTPANQMGYKYHASLVAAIMVGKTNGIAKGASNLYSAGVLTESELYSGVEWLLSQGVNVINLSMGYSDYNDPSKGANTNYNIDAKWFDHIAYNHSVHVVIASGNFGADRVTDFAMAYNVITVGNADDKGTVSLLDDSVATDSSYNSTKGGVAYKPDLCAPGTNISVPGITIGGQTYVGSGTSCSAPHVAGVVALLCSYQPYLLTKQALMKSVLLTATSGKKLRSDTQALGFSEYAQYKQSGGGIVNVFNAKHLIDTGNYVNSSIAESETYKEYSLGTLQRGDNVSITLSYLKRVGIRSESHSQNLTFAESDLSDLSLYVRYADGSNTTIPVETSANDQGNVEKIIFFVNETAEYKIQVYKTVGQDPYEIIFGLAWMKDFAGMQ